MCSSKKVDRTQQCCLRTEVRGSVILNELCMVGPRHSFRVYLLNLLHKPTKQGAAEVISEKRPVGEDGQSAESMAFKCGPEE